MTNEKLNTALYEKMFAEQETYRAWLLSQPSEEILNHTYEYTFSAVIPYMYMSDVTADDIRLALVPASKKSAGLYAKINMLIKCVFYSAERSQIIDCNLCFFLSY